MVCTAQGRHGLVKTQQGPRAEVNQGKMDGSRRFGKSLCGKKDRSWNALDSVEALEMPSDLEKAFSKNETARGYFEAFPRSAKRAILEWISNAKKPETRAKRVEETVTKAEQNLRANQLRQ